jgi:hypothetical protein
MHAWDQMNTHAHKELPPEEPYVPVFTMDHSGYFVIAAPTYLHAPVLLTADVHTDPLKPEWKFVFDRRDRVKDTLDC